VLNGGALLQPRNFLEEPQRKGFYKLSSQFEGLGDCLMGKMEVQVTRRVGLVSQGWRDF